MEKQFAKLFELETGEQILITKEYDGEDDSFIVKVTIEQDGVVLSLNNGFKDEEKQIECFNKIDLDGAEGMRNSMIKILEH